MIAKTFVKKPNPNSVGALASSLCLIHCIATPFLFLAQTCTATCCTSTPVWWATIDFLFIGMSYFAIYWSVKNSINSWIKYALWTSWVFLCLVILNEKIGLLTVPETSIYIPAIALILLHLYNRKYCECKDENCCATTN